MTADRIILLNLAWCVVAVASNVRAAGKWRHVLAGAENRIAALFRAAFAAVYAGLYAAQSLGWITPLDRARIVQWVALASFPAVWVYPAFKSLPDSDELDRAIERELERRGLGTREESGRC